MTKGEHNMVKIVRSSTLSCSTQDMDAHRPQFLDLLGPSTSSWSSQDISRQRDQRLSHRHSSTSSCPRRIWLICLASSISTTSLPRRPDVTGYVTRSALHA